MQLSIKLGKPTIGQLKITKLIANRESAALDKYLQEIRHEDLISIEEEIELAQHIKEGGRKVLGKLTKVNLGFVVSVARQYQDQGLSLSDLINEGNLGLIKAVRKFDKTCGFKFMSYAVWWIRQSTLQAIAEQSRIVGLPLNQVGSVNKINRISNKFEQEHERRPNVDETADQIDLPEDKIVEAMKVNGKRIFVDAPTMEGADGSLLDVPPSTRPPMTNNELVIESLREKAASTLNVLNECERNIIECFYGINQKEMILEEIGDRFDLTRGRVRQTKEKALHRLRQNTRSEQLKACLGR